MAYSTPLLVKVDGQDQLVSTGGDAAIAYEPLTGKEIWRVKYDGYSEVPRPVSDMASSSSAPDMTRPA